MQFYSYWCLKTYVISQFKFCYTGLYQLLFIDKIQEIYIIP